jgi:hypothetical protein
MKKNLTTTFIQLLRTKTIKNKIKTNIVKKIMKKEEKSYLNVVASKAKERNFFFCKAY